MFTATLFAVIEAINNSNDPSMGQWLNELCVLLSDKKQITITHNADEPRKHHAM